jgi:hypothetical protein
MTSRELNKKVREMFAKIAGDEYKWNCFRYSNPKNIVWKSYGWVGYKEVWQQIINELGGGWELFEGDSYRGDGSVYGMRKVK